MKRIYTLLAVLSILGFTGSNAFATLTVTINNKTQTQINMSDPVPVCAGSDIFFFWGVTNNPPTNPYTINSPAWSGTAAAFINDVNAPFVTFNCPNPGTYYLTFSATKTGYGTYTVTQTIVVYSSDNLYLDFPTSSPHNSCEGSAVMLEASGTSFYYWERRNDMQSIGSTAATVNETPPSTGTWTYRVYGYNEGCPTIPEFIEFDIDVDEAPTVDAGGPYEVCATSSVQLNGSFGGSASSAEWIGGLGSFNPSRTALNAFYTPHASEDGTTVNLILRSNDPPGVCSFAEDNATITVNSLPSGSITSQQNVSCFGGNNGEFTVEGSGAGAPYEYSLDGAPFQALGTFTGLTMGTYTVTIRNSNSCTFNVAVNITQPAAALTGSITNQVNVSCFGGNNGQVTVAGAQGTAPYQYSINGVDFQVSGTFTGLANGNYTVIIRDANLCTYPVSVNITQPATAVAGSIGAQTNVLCFGNSTGQVTVNGSNGTPPYNYSINGTTFQASGTFTNLAAGPYTIIVRDANLCTTGVPVTITQPAAPLTGSITNQDNVLCFGGNNGQVIVAGADGTAPYEYSIDGISFQASGLFSALTAGSYTITIRDNNGCTFDVPVTITEPATPLTGSITNQVNVSCFGGNNGEVTVAGANATPPYEYSINGGGFQVSGTFTGLTAGPYTITVRDNNLCTFDIPVNITQPAAALTGSITNQVNVLCFGGNNGEVTVAGSNGTAPYMYSIDGGSFQVSGTFTGLTQGNHTVTIRDANLCTHNVAVTITQPATPVAGSITLQTNVLCFGNNTGAVTVSGNNGTPPYNYSINGVNFQASGAFTGLAAGSYTVIVRDANLCTTGVPVTITQPAAPLTGSITTQTNVQCFGDNTGAVTVAGAQGTAPYEYSINGIAFQVSGTFSGLTAGSYTVTVRDDNMCTYDVTVSITQPIAPLSGTITNQINVSCFGGNDGEVTVAGANGTTPYEYSMDGINFQASGTFSNLALGNYIITIRDANLCTATVPVNITQPATALGGSIINQSNVNCSDSTDGEVTISGTGGTSPYQYSINDINFQGSGTFSGLAEGNYTINIQDANLCNYDVPVTITAPAPIQIDYFTVTSITDLGGCFGDATGSIEVLALGGTPNFVYSLYNGATLVNTQNPVHPAPATFSNLVASNQYRIVVTDANGCTPATQSDIVLIQPNQLIVTGVAITNAICYGEPNGTITITATGGTGDYIYSIYGEVGPYEIPNSFNVTSGFYDIWVMDDNGCTAEYPGNPVYIDEPSKIIFDYGITNIESCFGANEGSIIISNVNGGSGNYEFSIMEPPVWQTDPIFDNLPGGLGILYYVRVKDDAGCIVTGNNGLPVTIDEPAEITFSTTPTHVTGCWYNTNGSISITNVIGGTGIKWVSVDDTGIWQRISNATTIRYFNNLGVGDHIVRVRDRNNDANACEVTRVVTITGPPQIVISDISLTHNECFGDTNGEINVTTSGGTGALNYTLLFEGNPYAGPQASNVFVNLIAGDYTLEIRDDNNCLLTELFTITSPDELTLDTETVDISCNFSGPEGIIRAMSTGGNEPYTITLYMGGVEQANFTNVNSGDWVEFTSLAAASNYEVIVRDAKFPTCSELGSGMLTVIMPDVLEFNPASLIVQDLDCNGVPTGSITIAGQGGTLPYTYTLYDGASNQVGDPIAANDTNPVEFIDLPAGTYTVSINDANNCGPVDSAPITITEPVAIEIDPLLITITHISCFGANDGEISLSATGGTPDLFYTITQGGIPVVGFITQTNNGTFAPLAPGTYVITITDANNCGPVFSDELTVTEPNPIDISTVITDALCHGDNGSFTALATEGTPPYTYVLEDISNVVIDTQNGNAGDWVSFAGIPAGDYTLIVNDANGCNTSRVITIAEPDEVTIAITTAVSPTCDPDGTSNAGVIIAEAQGGSGLYTYTIYRNGAYLSDNTDGVFINLAAGDYYVEVSDTNGCGPATTTTETLTSPTSLQIDDVIVTDVNCYGQSTGELEVIYSGEVGIPQFTITAGDGGWQTGNTFTGLPAGPYTVRVKDDNFCIVTLEVTINQSPQIIITPVLTPPTTSLDFDGSIEVNITGGNPNYWYELHLWDQIAGVWNLVNNFDDTGLTSHTFTNLGVGAYRIIVRDIFSCEAIEDVSLSQFTVLLSGTHVKCNDACDGTITLNALGGVVQALDWTLDGQPFDMEPHWDAISGTYINLCAGLYTVLATDTENVESSAFFEITQPDPYLVTYIITVPNCYTNLAEGIVVFDIQGGTPFVYGYNITWDSGNAQGFMVDELAEGTYTFTITDQNGCEYIVEDVLIEYPEGMTMESFFTYNLLCNNNDSGGITMLVSGGTEPIAYAIDGPNGIEQNTDGIFNSLPAGEYTLSIVDDNGCAFIFEGEFSETVTLTEPDAIIITTLTSPIETLTCHNDTLDIVEMQVIGGTGEYTYSWSNGQEGLDLIEVGTGSYTLTVTDENGCETSEMVVVPGPDPFDVNATVTMAKCRIAPEGNDGTISINNITGGNGVFDADFNIKWYRKGFGHMQNSDGLWAVNELQAGEYYALVTDQKGCEDNIPFIIPFNEANNFEVGIDMEPNYCFGEVANLTAIPVQGTFGSPAQFEWYNLTQNENLIIGTTSSYTTPTLNVTQVILVRVVSSKGCLEQRRDTINVYPEIGPYLVRDDHPFFSNSDLLAFRIGNDPNNPADTTVITVLADTEYPVEIRTKAADYTLSYAWDSPFFSPFNEKNATVMFPTGQYESFQTGTLLNLITNKPEQYIPIVGYVMSQFGCVENIELKARILSKVRMSNVFSPNGDGINDLWFVPYADIFPNLQISIFNRWGAELWSAKASEATKGWDGRNKNGKDLPTGTYYYVISFNVPGSGKWKPISGSVTIVR